jgi:hypothetical protein
MKLIPPVGADLCVCPVNGQTVVLRGQTHRSAPTDGNDSDNVTRKGGHTGPPLRGNVDGEKT